MTVSVTVLATQTKLPTTEAWQKSLNANHFVVELDATCEVRNHEGFWPAKYQGRAAGFELHRGSPDEFFSEYPNLAGTFDVAISLVTHSNMARVVLRGSQPPFLHISPAAFFSTRVLGSKLPLRMPFLGGEM